MGFGEIGARWVGCWSQMCVRFLDRRIVHARLMYLVHIEADLTNDGKVVWFKSACVRQAPQVSFGHSTP